MPPGVHAGDFRLVKHGAEADDSGMSTILVPVDFSDRSGRLLAAAEEAARARGASLHLLHVIEPVVSTSGLGMDPPVPLEITPEPGMEEKIGSGLLDKMAAEVSARGIPCTSAVKLGLPVDEILAAVADIGVKLVVLGSHGRGALYHLFTGSVVTGVLRRIDCPVLVVPLRQNKA